MTFSLVETIFFHSYFLEGITVIRKREISKKNLFLQVETVFFNFFTYWLESSQFFSPLKPYFSIRPLFLASGNWSLVTYKLNAFIGSFFRLMGTNLETRCKPIFLDFSILNSWSSFTRVETDFLSSGLLFRTNFVLGEAITQIKIKPFLESNLSPIIGNHFLRLFRCSCLWKQHFCVVKTKPLFHCIFHSDWWNHKFCLVEKLFSYLQLFSCLWKPLLALNSVSISWNEELFWKILFHCTEQPNQYWILRNFWQEYPKNGEKDGFY